MGGSLRFVLTHEFIHIRRFDAAAKLLLTAALCIHWFNPLVWVLYVLANRDMELACDEEVVRQAGQQEKAAYALTLIHMEEKKSRLMPLCNNFSKSAIQGRITSIMKTRRASVITVLVAAALVLAVSAAFATSASGQHALRPIPGTAFTQGEYEQLLALQLDGYQDMTVAQYRERVWEATDTAAYGELLQRFSQDEQLYGMKDQNETAAFLFYLLEPLTAQRLDHRYGGYTRTDLPGAAEQASLEYAIDLSIQDPDGLTVRQYCEARVGMMRGMQALLQGKTPAELQDQAAMDAYLQKEVSRLTEAWRSGALHIEASYFYTPYTPAEDPGSRSAGPAEQEPRVFGPGTAADYRSLLALQTPGYRDMPLAAFNDTVLQWANEDYDRMERINEDVARGSYGVPLTEAEQAFVSLTVRASGNENAQQIKSIQTGQTALDPGFAEDFPLREEGSQGAAWCSFYYQFSYHIPDAARITVGQRDSSLLGMLGTARDLWSRSTLDELLQLTEGDIRTMLRTAAAENSSELITLHIDENQVIFEHNDERDRV